MAMMGNGIDMLCGEQNGSGKAAPGSEQNGDGKAGHGIALQR